MTVGSSCQSAHLFAHFLWVGSLLGLGRGTRLKLLRTPRPGFCSEPSGPRIPCVGGVAGGTWAPWESHSASTCAQDSWLVAAANLASIPLLVNWHMYL